MLGALGSADAYGEPLLLETRKPVPQCCFQGSLLLACASVLGVLVAISRNSLSEVAPRLRHGQGSFSVDLAEDDDDDWLNTPLRDVGSEGGGSQPSGMEPEKSGFISGGDVDGSTVVTFGQHKGKTFADLKDSEPGYVDWVLRQQEPTEDMEKLIEYLKAEGVESGQGAGFAREGTGDTMMMIGKYKGRSFADLKATEPGYVSWCLKQQDPSGELQVFINYLKGEVPDEGHTAMPVQGTDHLADQTAAGGDAVFNIGKNRGRTYADVKANDPGYVSWALREREPSGELQSFVDYLKAEGVSAEQPTASPASAGDFLWNQTGGETVMRIGRYRGRTFADVKASEPGYVSWCLRQEDPSGDLQAFIEYLKAEGASAPADPTSPVKPGLPAQPADISETLFTIGKFKGRTFGSVKKMEPGYVEWARKQENASGELQAFISYVRGDTPLAVDPPLADTMLTFGPHVGKTFGDVAVSALEWVGQIMTGPTSLQIAREGEGASARNMRGFIEYVCATQGKTSPLKRGRDREDNGPTADEILKKVHEDRLARGGIEEELEKGRTGFEAEPTMPG